MTKLCKRGKEAAKTKIRCLSICIREYAYASKICAGKVTPGGKKKVQKKSVGGSVSQERKNGNIKTPSNVSRGCGMVMSDRRKKFTVS